MGGDGRGIYRSRADSKALKEAVLDLWADDFQSKDIGALLGIGHDYAHCIVRRARAAGDARATARHHLNPDHAKVVAEFGSQQARLARLIVAGKSTDEIVAITGTTRRSVHAARFRAGLTNKRAG